MWKKGDPYTLLGEMYISTDFMGNSMEISPKLKLEVSYDPIIPLLGIY
jgi:hypothetical protein